MLEAVKTLPLPSPVALGLPALQGLEHEGLRPVCAGEGNELPRERARRIKAQAGDAPVQRAAEAAARGTRLGLLLRNAVAERVALAVGPAARKKRAGYHCASGIDDDCRDRGVDTDVDGANPADVLLLGKLAPRDCHRTHERGLGTLEHKARRELEALRQAFELAPQCQRCFTAPLPRWQPTLRKMPRSSLKKKRHP